MPKIHSSWWNLALDGKLHHIEAGNSPYGSTASLRSRVYQEALERGKGAVTYVEPMTQALYVQAFPRRGGQRPSQLWKRLEESSLMPDSFGYRVPPIPVLQQNPQAVAMLQAKARVQAAGLDPEDQDLIEERLYCSCGVGNATGDLRHDPGCGVWG